MNSQEDTLLVRVNTDYSSATTPRTILRTSMLGPLSKKQNLIT